jgi:hypothetical protein
VEITPLPQPEAPVVLSKPEPLPEPIPQPTVQETPPVIAPAPPEAPKHLPKTASPMGLIGLIGLASMSGYLTRFFRR